jgi:hypothetical protein
MLTHMLPSLSQSEGTDCFVDLGVKGPAPYYSGH